MRANLRKITLKLESKGDLDISKNKIYWQISETSHDLKIHQSTSTKIQ